MKIVAIGVVLLLVGCTSYEYTSPDGHRVKIVRFASDAMLDGAKITTPTGTTLQITGYKSEAHRVVEAAVGAAVREGLGALRP